MTPDAPAPLPAGHPAAAATADAAAVPRLVGIGASAGGLDALCSLLAQVPAASGLAWAVVQHLDPNHKAMLAQLLQRTTTMPVCEAAVRQRIVADHVYVIPPNRVMTLAQGALELQVPQQAHGLRRPIDALFESLAADQAQAAIGIVLSGMGSDGTVGLQAIHACGGLTMAQQPDTAQFDAMPSSAIASGCVDIVCAPQDMPSRLLAALAGPAPGAPQQPPGAADALRQGGLDAVLDLLHRRGRHDFRQYKRSTLQRRVERRIGIHGLGSVQQYVQMLRGNPQELDLLFKELLIGVTAFFRDTLVWQALRETALPALLASRADGQTLRAWVPGCSTGEEAYSLAMVFREAVDATPQRSRCTLQIFATDLSHDAIARARRGLYPAAISGEVSAARLERFFSRRGDAYRVSAAVRESLVFAPHDVTADPPFTRLDLLSCRNLLIYLTAPLQQRLLQLFHYSLHPGGLLLLGSSETVGRQEQLFDALGGNLRLYRRRDGPRTVLMPDLSWRAGAPAQTHSPELPMADDPPPQPALQDVADRVLLQLLSPPAVLVDEAGDIVYINGHTGKYLEPAAGKANWNLHAMAREGLRQPLQAALLQSADQPGAVELHGVPLHGGNDGALVDISVRRLLEPASIKDLRLVVFRDVQPLRPGHRRRSASAQAELEHELTRMREEAQALHEEMRASQEELQSANEELQSANEELQSTNEELTSSKEEMQSMNEELQAVNAELQSKLDDLALAQSDMHNLLNSTDIATLFLDKDINVRRFTERARRIFRLRDNDVGRPLSDLATSLDYPDLEDDVQTMLRTLVVSEREIHSADGKWYAVRVMPYRTLDNVIQGAVITFVDITAAKALEARLRAEGRPGAQRPDAA